MAAPTSIFSVMTGLAIETGAINLGQGFPDEDGPAAILDAAAQAMRDGHNQYAPPKGVPALREAVAAHQSRSYGLSLDPETEVQVTFGATEALAAALLALVDHGDEVIALDPTYDSYRPIVERAGGSLRPIVLEPPAWRVTEESVLQALNPRTRILLLNSPHNPTGRVLDRSELELLAALCIEHDLIAITDEVYEHLVFDGEHVPLASLPGMRERTLTVSSIGKTYALTGWKIGWISGPSELVAQVHAIKQFLTFSGGTPLQHAAAVALDLPDADIRAAADVLAGKRDRLATGLQAAGLDVLPSAGTYFLNADVSPVAGDTNATELCLRLPHDAGVVAIPIAAFRANPGGPARSIVRFAFCKRDEVLDEACERLAAWGARQR
ncbi:MAG: aminotransferase class I/II-fold pyridoxal phosphate-dependent enzyme [Solirubrobacteraceae bacterium]|nr:aminotransferase class I/II-fold pyridoxal phosphate-dependent enzyme [Patulibacter sp.]